MEQVEQMETASCNTIERTPTRGKTRMYLLTINNPTEDDVATIDNLMEDDKVVDLIGQHERGEEGTLHIQLMINWKNPRAFNGVKKLFPRAHIEAAQHLVKAARYCSKDDTREELEPSWEKIGSKSLLKIWNKGTEEQRNRPLGVVEGSIDYMEGHEYSDWMKLVLDIYETEPDLRAVHWFYDPVGNSGKSLFTRHLKLQYDGVVMMGGSANDCKYVVGSWIVHYKWKKHPRMFIYDVARCKEGQFVSYQAIENMKDGNFVSTKYEGFEVTFNRPHMIVFSNHLPDISKLSLDRWNIYEIHEGGSYTNITKEHVELSIEDY